MEDFLRNLSRGRDVLDIGCGSGEFTLNQANECRNVFAFDSDKKKVLQLMKKLVEEKITNVSSINREIFDVDAICSDMIDVAICRLSVNGSEGNLLMNAFEMIRIYQPILVIRIGHKLNRSAFDVGKIMGELNYMYPIPFDTHYIYFPSYHCQNLRELYLQGKSKWKLYIEDRNRYAFDGVNSYRIFTITDTKILILFGTCKRIGLVEDNRIVFDNGIHWIAQ